MYGSVKKKIAIMKSWLGRHVRSGVTTALVTSLLGFVVWYYQVRLTRLSYDLLFAFKPRAIPSEAVVIYQDDVSYDILKQTRRRPWSRTLHTDLLDRLQKEQARGVVFDILFDEESDPESDRLLRQAIKSNGKVVLAGEMIYTDDLGVPMEKIRRPLESFATNAASWGLATMACHDDNTVRVFYPGTPELPSLSWRAAELAGAAVCQPPDTRGQERWLNYYGPTRSIPHVSYHQAWYTNGTAPGFFRNKMVFVGAHLQTGFGGEAKDSFRHPYLTSPRAAEPMPGVEVHATAYLNLLRHEWLTKPSGAAEGFLILLFGLGFGFLVVQFRPRGAILVSLGTILGLLAVCGLGCGWFKWWFSWLVPIAIQIPIGFTGSVLFHFARLHTEMSVLEHSLSQHLDPARVRQILRNPDLRKPGGNYITISILFSDIAHFSRISGRMHPEDLIRLLNQYFETSLSLLHVHQGTIIKLLGDAIFAIWNAPVPQADHQQKTCLAALQLRDALANFSTGQGSLPLRTRIGLHTGQAFVGNVGSLARVDFTAIGENVNLASRLEGLNKHLGTDILASRDIQKSVENTIDCRMVGYFRLQGFDRVVEVHELIGPIQSIEVNRPWKECFADALHHFHRRGFDAAEAGFRKTLQLRPDDQPSLFYLQQIELLRLQPPPYEWAGEIELKEK
jgi:adenylate cyclase